MITFCLLVGVFLLSIPDIFFFLRSLSLAKPRHRSMIETDAPSDLWQGLKGGEHCLRHATREYTARLQTTELPAGEEVMKACRDTPVEIHGNMLYTNFCQNLGFGRGIWGFWIVDFDEPDCETKWGEFEDLGCVEGVSYAETAVRRIESHLENLQPGSDWQFMCVTTPADINGHHFQTPTNCLNLGHLDILGLWDIPDISCTSAPYAADEGVNANRHSKPDESLLDQNQLDSLPASWSSVSGRLRPRRR